MQKHLQNAGYDTAFVGKLHYWPPTREKGLESGFNEGRIHDAADSAGSNLFGNSNEHDKQNGSPVGKTGKG